jgi:branched-chain amino acid transport system ATP-binding protein
MVRPKSCVVMKEFARPILANPSDPVLDVQGLSGGYGPITVVRDASLRVTAGEIVGLVGRNGAGKTTFISAVAGLLERTAGSVRLAGQDMSQLPAHARVRAGLALVPSGGHLFKSLTVEENLLIGVSRPSPRDIEAVFAVFPELRPLRRRYAGRLSGGERQMVAIGRALALKPRLILLDEPSEGLAPIVVLRLVQTLKSLQETGLAVLVAEQNVRFTELTCQRSYLIEKGRVSEAPPLSPPQSAAAKA